jgi:hypothetical protein
MPVAPISKPFSDEEEAANAHYRAMSRRAGEAMRSGHDGKSALKNTEHQEALLHDARVYAEAKVKDLLKGRLAAGELGRDPSEAEIQAFVSDFKRSLMLDLWENYVPRSPYKADLNLSFEEFAVAVCSEGRSAINNVVDAAIRASITPSGGSDGAGKARIRRKLRALKDEAGDRVTFDSMVPDFARHGYKLTVAAIRKHHSVDDGHGPKSTHLRIYADIYSGVLDRTISVEWLTSPDERD